MWVSSPLTNEAQSKREEEEEREKGERNPADKDRSFCCFALPRAPASPVRGPPARPTRNRASKRKKNHRRNEIVDGGEGVARGINQVEATDNDWGWSGSITIFAPLEGKKTSAGRKQRVSDFVAFSAVFVNCLSFLGAFPGFLLTAAVKSEGKPTAQATQGIQDPLQPVSLLT